MSDFPMPAVHMNGTSSRELMQLNVAAGEALRDALIVAVRATPHGRDYYPIGQAALRDALKEHRKHCEAITEAIKHFALIAEHVGEVSRG